MNTRYHYWLFRDVISKKDRKKIQGIAKEAGYKKAGTMSHTDKIREDDPDKNIRDTEISWSSNEYLYNLFCPMVTGANENAGWNFDVQWYEGVQIAKYTKGKHYSWHSDGGSDSHAAYVADESNPTVSENYAGKVRKLSLIGILSNGYEGGELQFARPKLIEPGESDLLEPKMKVGDVCVFPSYISHRSTPVTKGTKYSLAMWCLGPPFK